MTITFPATREELTHAGYSPSYTRPCKKCGEMLEFWSTPTGSFMPLEMNRMTAKRIPHWQVCPFADEFRRKEKDKDVEKKSEQKELFR